MPTKLLHKNGGAHLQALREIEELPLDVTDQSLQELDPVWWAERNLRTDHGTPLDFSEHPYLELIYEDWHPFQVYYKGAQVGMTQTTTGKLLYFALRYPITGIYTMPTQEQVERYSTARFNRIIGSSPKVKAQIKNNNAGFKQIGESQIYFAGTFNAQQAISVPADIRVHDELDFSKDDIVELFEERLAASKWDITWLYSTPTIRKFGVHSYWLKSDQRHWMVKCSGCGKRQRIRWDNHAVHNVREEKKYGRHIRWYFGCQDCDKELDRREGEWVVRKPSRSAKSHGYHVPQTIVPHTSADKLKAKEEEARSKGRIKRFYNFNLGEAFSEGKTLITKELIKSRTRIFQEIYNTDRYFLGIDQGDLKHLVLCRMYEDVRVIVRLETYNSWDDVKKFITEYRPKITVIDALPNKDSAKEVRDAFPGRVFLIYYKDNQMSQIKRNVDANEFSEVRDKDEYAFSADHTESLDKTASEWVDGNAWLHGQPDTIDSNTSLEGMFAEHMANLKRDEEEDRHGNMRGVWKKVGPDHFRHADNYARIALDVFGRNTDFESRTGGSAPVAFESDLGELQWTETPEGILIPKKSEMEWEEQ